MPKQGQDSERSILDLCADILRKVSGLKIACDLVIKATELMLREHYVRINVKRRLSLREIKAFRKEAIYWEKDRFSDLVKLFNILYIGLAYGGIEKKFAIDVLTFIEDHGSKYRYNEVTVEAADKNEIKFRT